jgi:hypothetical protein
LLKVVLNTKNQSIKSLIFHHDSIAHIWPTRLIIC